MAAVTEVVGVLKKGDMFALEPTSPSDTREAMRNLLAKLRPKPGLPSVNDGIPEISIANCRERVLPGVCSRN